jgi:D-alanyl-lipoteichoic acid acyltransferase DltB (MBOAT superfamily)
MLFPTIRFAVFFGVVLAVGWRLAAWPKWWKRFILLASYVFYGAWNPRFVLLIAFTTVANQAFATRIHRAQNRGAAKLLLFGAIVLDLGVLGYFKYYGFFSSSLVNFLGDMGVDVSLPVVQTLLPVGISFFTFHAISYVVDVYRGTCPPARFMDFAVYMAFFPHLVAGPIVRATELIPQLRRRLDPRRIDVSRAAFLIVLGLFKKVVVASYLSSHIVDKTFANPGQHSALEVLFGVYAYAIQIYADFSGYTDIAIACALLMGIQFPENFNSPYTAVSLQDFWRRWHMTLSRWLRDYVYIPLGGSRKGENRTYVNLMITMLLGGLWHGADWKFVVWGGLHGAGQVVGMAMRRARERRDTLRREALGLQTSATEERDILRRMARLNRGLPDSMSRDAQVSVLPRVETRLRHRQEARVERAANPDTRRIWLARFGVFQYVCLGWIFFRAESLSRAFEIIDRIFTGWTFSAPLVTPLLLFVIGAMLAAQYVPRPTMDAVRARFSLLRPAVQAVLVALAILVIDVLGPQGVAPFIYFQF